MTSGRGTVASLASRVLRHQSPSVINTSSWPLTDEQATSSFQALFSSRRERLAIRLNRLAWDCCQALNMLSRFFLLFQSHHTDLAFCISVLKLHKCSIDYFLQVFWVQIYTMNLRELFQRILKASNV